MNFNPHGELAGKHAFLGPSKYHWINYDADHLMEAYERASAVERGVILHDFAKRAIELGQKLPRSNKTLNAYVNDAIGFRMTPEQPLFYSENCFGTADAISFKDRKLRIHDLKTGKTPAHIEQLLVYSALFCLEYRQKPKDISIELRIYQNDEVLIHEPEADEIDPIIDKIITFDKIINRMKEDGR